MATRFSWTVSFRASIFCWKRVKSFSQARMMSQSSRHMTGMTTTMTSVSLAFMKRQTTSAESSCTGARTSIRRHIMTVIWMELTSFVSLVMSEAEEKRSMSAKEKSWILSNIAPRRLRPKPWLATAAAFDAVMPL